MGSGENRKTGREKLTRTVPSCPRLKLGRRRRRGVAYERNGFGRGLVRRAIEDAWKQSKCVGGGRGRKNACTHQNEGRLRDPREKHERPLMQSVRVQ